MCVCRNYRVLYVQILMSKMKFLGHIKAQMGYCEIIVMVCSSRSILYSGYIPMLYI